MPDIIHAKGVKNPRIFAMPEGGFGIVAVRVNEDGSADEDSRGSVLLWTTADFKEFKKIGFLPLHGDAYVERAQCRYDKNTGEYCILWQDDWETAIKRSEGYLQLNRYIPGASGRLCGGASRTGAGGSRKRKFRGDKHTAV